MTAVLTAYSRVARAVLRTSQRRWRFVVVLMLVLLHVAVLRGVEDNGARALLLAHLGLLLLWQPFLGGESRVTGSQAILIVLGAAVVTLWLNWWLLALWVIVLAGIVGGKVFQESARWQRRFYLAEIVYLLALLTIVILPEIAPRREITPEIYTGAEYGLPFILAAMAFFPTEPDAPEMPQVIDLFYSVFMMLILIAVVLGSFTFMTLGRTEYMHALTYTVFLVAGGLYLIAFAWSPRIGYGGFGVFFSRYLYSIGLPVERWLHFLAELSHVEERPERFLSESVAGLVRLPWVVGASWNAAHGKGETGETSGFVVDFKARDIELRIYSRYRNGPMLDWHLRLLGELLAEFYVAKLREQELRQSAYLQAVYETGARVTHDVKNLLQSLNVLCSVAEQDERGAGELQALFKRQLPAISRRLADTLEKLQRPEAELPSSYLPVTVWWEVLVRQYRDEGVEFTADGLSPDLHVPRALFDSVADNLLRNALAKRGATPGLRVRVTLRCRRPIELRISDTGAAVPEEIARDLLRAPVPSAGGTGIGLFQAARLAAANGYRLALERNADGEVCFALAEDREI